VIEGQNFHFVVQKSQGDAIRKKKYGKKQSHYSPGQVLSFPVG
jgi:hypothetical protein